jgi:hypothetical protein
MMRELPWIALAFFLAGLTFVVITDIMQNQKVSAYGFFLALIVISILSAVSLVQS